MYEEFKKNFLEFYQNNKDKKFVISAHRHPDSDAIASAYALNSIFPNSIIGLQDHLSEDTKPLMEKLGIKYKLLKELKKSSYDGLIVTDCHSYTLLKDAEGWNIVLLIDHHHKEGKSIHAPLEFIDSDSPSSSEIVYTLIPKVSKKVAFALAAAIISDTARFKSAKFSSFEILSKLIKLSGSDYLEIFKHAYPRESMDKRVAILTAFQRVEYLIYSNYLIVTSHVGVNESMAAILLSDVADVVFIASDKHHETRVSARVGQHVEIPANEIMNEVGKRLGGAGGGHPKASGATVPANLKETLEECVEVLKTYIDKNKL